MKNANIPSSIHSDLNAKYDAIKASIQRLNQYLEKSAIHSEVYLLPRVTQEHETDPIFNLKPTKLQGQEALQQALAAYHTFYAQPGESRRSVFRLPGLILLDVREELTCSALVSRVNTAKSEFIALVNSITGNNSRHTTDLRFQIISTSFPNLIRLQIERSIMLIDGEIVSISFGWGHKPIVSALYTKDVLERLSRFQSRPQTIANQDLFAATEIDMRRIQQLPSSTKFHYRRDVKTKPILNFTTDCAEGQHPANIPVIAFGQPKVIRSLPEYDTEKHRRKQKQRQSDLNSDIPYLDIFRVKDQDITK